MHPAMAPRLLALRGVLATCAIVLVLGGPAAPLVSAGSSRSSISIHPVATVLRSPSTHPRLHGRPAAASPAPALLAIISRSLPITVRPGGGRVIGIMPAWSVYGHRRIVAWIMARSADGRYGRVSVPFRGGDLSGWISLRGLALRSTPIMVVADLSRHLLTVTRLGKVILRVPAATGAPSSPTPIGHYFVTDRVPEAPGGPFGAFIFGISGIQTHLPPGWGGGNLLAIHGTNNPATIGTSESAGCLRVAAWVVKRLEPLLQIGTPVVIVA